MRRTINGPKGRKKMENGFSRISNQLKACCLCWCLFSLLFSATPAYSADELKLAHFMPPVHTLHQKVFQPLAEALSKETDGELTIRIYPAGALGKGPVQQYKRAVTGVADITFCLQNYTAGIFPRSLLITRPGLVANAEAGTRKLWEIYDPWLKTEYEAIKLLGLWAMSPTTLMTRERKVASLADIKGMKVRISSPIESELVQAWGAVPVAMPITESYSALTTGVVDAVLIQPSALYKPWNLAEPAKHLTVDLPSPASVVFLAMNRQRWEGLSPAHQAALDRLTGRDFSIRASGLWSAKDTAAVAQAEKDPDLSVTRLTKADREVFRKAADPTITKELTRLKALEIDAQGLYQALRN
jgi:TRAP-type C4-dicarboxylate transport system substrate-binding protein